MCTGERHELGCWFWGDGGRLTCPEGQVERDATMVTTLGTSDMVGHLFLSQVFGSASLWLLGTSLWTAVRFQEKLAEDLFPCSLPSSLSSSSLFLSLLPFLPSFLSFPLSLLIFTF